MTTIMDKLALKNGRQISQEDLTNIRFEIILKMLEADPKLRKRVKGLALLYL